MLIYFIYAIVFLILAYVIIISFNAINRAMKFKLLKKTDISEKKRKIFKKLSINKNN